MNALVFLIIIYRRCSKNYAGANLVCNFSKRKSAHSQDTSQRWGVEDIEPSWQKVTAVTPFQDNRPCLTLLDKTSNQQNIRRIATWNIIVRFISNETFSRLLNYIFHNHLMMEYNDQIDKIWQQQSNLALKLLITDYLHRHQMWDSKSGRLKKWVSSRSCNMNEISN